TAEKDRFRLTLARKFLAARRRKRRFAAVLWVQPRPWHLTRQTPIPAAIFGGLRLKASRVFLASRRTTMTSWCFKLAGRFLSAALLTGLLWTAAASAASAQQVPAEQIIKA